VLAEPLDGEEGVERAGVAQALALIEEAGCKDQAAAGIEAPSGPAVEVQVEAVGAASDEQDGGGDGGHAAEGEVSAAGEGDDGGRLRAQVGGGPKGGGSGGAGGEQAEALGAGLRLAEEPAGGGGEASAQAGSIEEGGRVRFARKQVEAEGGEAGGVQGRQERIKGGRLAEVGDEHPTGPAAAAKGERQFDGKLVGAAPQPSAAPEDAAARRRKLIRARGIRVAGHRTGHGKPLLNGTRPYRQPVGRDEQTDADKTGSQSNRQLETPCPRRPSGRRRAL